MVDVEEIVRLVDRFVEEVEKFAKKKDKPRGDFVFPKSHSKVKEGDHFPINTIGRARNALARASQYSKAPSWYKGSLTSLVSAVARAVKGKYTSIEVSEKGKKPRKG
jgi:hypothetical protein